MIKHIVCHKLSDKSAAPEIAARLTALVGQVPSLRSMDAGADVKNAARSYDVALIAVFDDMAGLAEYDTHPAHEAVRAFIRQYSISSVSVDFEVSGTV